METRSDSNNMQNPGMLAPGLGNAFHHGWETMKNHFLELLLVILVVIVAQIPTGLSGVGESAGFSPLTGLLQVFVLAYGILVLAPVSYGSHWLFLRAARNEHFQTTEVFEGFKLWQQVVLANILVAAIVIAGIILLVIPGIVFACKLVFVPYLVMDKKLDAVEAVKKSWKMTTGHGWTVFFMGLLSFFIVLAGLILLIVGVIPAAIWISASFASLYHAVDQEEKEKT
ncbi:MAG: hypothetical protein GXO83_05690 [Chlorobi bacterium]|nr:hypothetical protein [Chlorobiota bacterium]